MTSSPCLTLVDVDQGRDWITDIDPFPERRITFDPTPDWDCVVGYRALDQDRVMDRDRPPDLDAFLGPCQSFLGPKVAHDVAPFNPISNTPPFTGTSRNNSTRR